MRIRLMKPVFTRYRNAAGKSVPKGTAKAKKVQEESDKWYAEWYVNRKKKRKPLATDKTVAQKMLGDLIQRMEKGEANLTDPFRDHRRKALFDHVEDYLKSLGKTLRDGSAGKHYYERKRLLKTTLAEMKAGAGKTKTEEDRDKILKKMTTDDITKERLLDLLDDLGTSARTRDTHRGAVNVFCNWMKERGRTESNPVADVREVKGKVVRVRRALTPQQIQKVLDAARSRPLEEVMTIRRGPRKGQLTANVGERVKERMHRLGRERALIYKTAALTGLRRKELRSLRVYHLELDSQPWPKLKLPGIMTKNGEDAKLLLVKSLADELRQWIQDTEKAEGDPLFHVVTEIVKEYKEDLAAAGIKYQDGDGRYADFHALRMAADTMLGVANVKPRIRQLFMRHSDIKLTMETYDDANLYDLEEAARALENVQLK